MAGKLKPETSDDDLSDVCWQGASEIRSLADQRDAGPGWSAFWSCHGNSEVIPGDQIARLRPACRLANHKLVLELQNGNRNSWHGAD